jgi:hypothetical protein
MQPRAATGKADSKQGSVPAGYGNGMTGETEQAAHPFFLRKQEN